MTQPEKIIEKFLEDLQTKYEFQPKNFHFKPGCSDSRVSGSTRRGGA